MRVEGVKSCSQHKEVEEDKREKASPPRYIVGQSLGGHLTPESLTLLLLDYR